ncbi:hypothetical protein D3C77_346550 [compost metagenome]
MLEHLTHVRLILAAQVQLMTQSGKARGIDSQLAGVTILKAWVSTFRPRYQFHDKSTLGSQGTPRQELGSGGKVLHRGLQQALPARQGPEHAPQQYRLLVNLHQFSGVNVKLDTQVGFKPGLEQGLGKGAQSLEIFQCRGQGVRRVAATLLSVEQRLAGSLAGIEEPGGGAGRIKLGRPLAFAPTLEVGNSGVLEPVRQAINQEAAMQARDRGRLRSEHKGDSCSRLALQEIRVAPMQWRYILLSAIGRACSRVRARCSRSNHWPPAPPAPAGFCARHSAGDTGSTRAPGRPGIRHWS